MCRSYCPILVRLDGADTFLIWFSDDVDGVVIDGGAARSFRNEAALHDFAERAGLVLEPGVPPRFDLDAIERWRTKAGPDGVDCPAFLDAWNLADDVARSLDREAPGRRASADNVYDKLFWGCNLPSVTPAGERYDPTWSGDEINELSCILAECLSQLRSARSKR